MQIFSDTKFDFMGKKLYAAIFSLALFAVCFGAILVKGFNLGVDFRGGAEVEFKFLEPPDIATLRSTFSGLGVGEVSLQRVGRPEDHTVLVRAGGGEGGERVSDHLVQALYTPEETAARAAGRRNLNQVGEEDLTGVLGACLATGGAAPDSLAAAIVARRTADGGILRSYDEVASLPGMEAEALDCVRSATFLPGFAKWKDYFVGPKVGKELRNKAYWAIGASLLGILLYLTLRFQFEYGIGAVVALFHDVIITTGVLVLLGEEFSLTVIAALLTLAGYSVNDTIVVFDRIRENLRSRRTLSLAEVMNLSINQTLSRTVLTAGTTLLVVLAMLLLGGMEFHGFAVALLIGIVLGTYSSIFVASPLVVVWNRRFGSGRQRRPAHA